LTRCSIESAAVRISTGRREPRAQAAQHFQTGQLGQAQVQYQQIEFLGGEGGVGFLAIAYAIDGIARLAQ
jgi:hypothetical protein